MNKSGNRKYHKLMIIIYSTTFIMFHYFHSVYMWQARASEKWEVFVCVFFLTMFADEWSKYE